MGSPVPKVLEHISLEENGKLNYKGIYTLGGIMFVGHSNHW